MTTLSGHRSSPSINYYSGDSFSVDLSTAGFAPGSTWTFTVHCTSSSCVDQIGFDVYLQRPLPSNEACFHWSTITPSGAPLTSFTYGPHLVGDGVEWGGVSGATGCTDFTRVTFAIKSYTYPGACAAEWDWSITYTGTGGTVGVCAYGTERQPSVPQAIAIVTVGLLVAAGVVLEPWLLGGLIGILGSAVSINALCSTVKPADQVIAESDWTSPFPGGVGSLAHHKIALNVQNKLWDFFCHCTPAPSGSPAPTSPPVTVISAPTYLTTYNNIQINNTEISTTINDLWQYFLNFNIGNQNSITIGQQTQECACTNLKLGSAHEGLTGEGAFAVSGIHGLSVIYTTLPPRIGMALGDPDTIYTGAWINVGNDWGWQPRMFPNTIKWMAFPPDMHQMTVVGYSIPEDVVLTIAELVQA